MLGRCCKLASKHLVIFAFEAVAVAALEEVDQAEEVGVAV